MAIMRMPFIQQTDLEYYFENHKIPFGHLIFHLIFHSYEALILTPRVT